MLIGSHIENVTTVTPFLLREEFGVNSKQYTSIQYTENREFSFSKSGVTAVTFLHKFM